MGSDDRQRLKHPSRALHPPTGTKSGNGKANSINERPVGAEVRIVVPVWFRLKWLVGSITRANDGAWWVVTLSILVVALTAAATVIWWDPMIRGDTTTNVLRNMALIGAE